MFPGPGARIYRNEAGEPLGWDSSDAYDPGDPGDPHDDTESAADCAAEKAYDWGQEEAEEGKARDAQYGAYHVPKGWEGSRWEDAARWLQQSYDEGYEDGRAGPEGER